MDVLSSYLKDLPIFDEFVKVFFIKRHKIFQKWPQYFTLC